MNSDQYWQWFWLHTYYSLLFGLPVFVGSLIWALLQWHQELHEDDEPEHHFTELKLR